MEEVILMGYITREKHISERVIDPDGICFTLMAMTHGYGQGFIYEDRSAESNGLWDLIADILPFLPYESGFVDTRHWIWGGLKEEFPFSVTTRINANEQQFLIEYEQQQETD